MSAPGAGCDGYLALAAVPAGELVALVDHADLTVAPREADGAAAGVVAPRVEAGGAVVAGPVVGAEVEVLVAHLAAPALLALAGPGRGAGPVHAPRVDLALRALRALPTLVTPGEEEHIVSRLLEGKYG